MSFWLAVQAALRIQSAPSTAYDPQTDGQTERTNQTMETYLRHFCSHRQDDWADWLPVAEFSFNNATSSSTKLSPFFSWQGFHPRANSFMAPSKVPTADAFVALLEEVQLSLVEALRHAKEVQSRFYNAHSRPAPVFPPGSLVWLSCRYIPSTRPASKLDYRRIGPFRVAQMVGMNAVRLILGPSYSRLHPVFNVSLVSPYVDPSVAGRSAPLLPAPLPSTLAPLRNWRHVSAILDFRVKGKFRSEYLLRWAGCPPSDDAWIPLSDISTNLDPYLWEFHRRYPQLKVPVNLLSGSRSLMGQQAVLR